MIEVYIDNYDDPEQVENTVKEYCVEIEHAENITCVTTSEEMVSAIEALNLKILCVRGASDGKSNLGTARRFAIGT